MEKKEYLVDVLLANSSTHCWSKDDREFLMNQTEKFLLDQLGTNKGSAAEKAFSASFDASSASRKAITEGTAQAHKAAADAHKKAMAAQEEVGASYSADDHARRAAEHDKMSTVLSAGGKAPPYGPYSSGY